jgi:predicted MFS family arabinose efflux permease
MGCAPNKETLLAGRIVIGIAVGKFFQLMSCCHHHVPSSSYSEQQISLRKTYLYWK